MNIRKDLSHAKGNSLCKRNMGSMGLLLLEIRKLSGKWPVLGAGTAEPGPSLRPLCPRGPFSRLSLSLLLSLHRNPVLSDCHRARGGLHAGLCYAQVLRGHRQSQCR